jgi:hypothetical protein
MNCFSCDYSYKPTRIQVRSGSVGCTMIERTGFCPYSSKLTQAIVGCSASKKGGDSK